MTWCAWVGRERWVRRGVSGLPALDGDAERIGVPSSRLRLACKGSAGLTRMRAEAQRGVAPERHLGGEHLRHRSCQGERPAVVCQRV